MTTFHGYRLIDMTLHRYFPCFVLKTVRLLDVCILELEDDFSKLPPNMATATCY